MTIDGRPSQLAELPTPAKVSFGQSVAYGVGNISGTIMGYAMAPALIFPVFSIALGVSPSLVGLTLAVSRGIDFFTDPLAGYLSDTYLHKFGRRWFVACGSVAGGVCFAGVWLFPPNISPHGSFLWLLAFSCATLIGWSFSAIPYQAWGYEISPDPNERTKLMAFATALGMLSGVAFGWAYAGTQLKFFGGTVPGARWIGCTMAAGVIITGLLSVFLCRTGTQAAVLRTAPDRPPGLKDFILATRRVTKCRPLLFLTSALFIFNLAQLCIQGLGIYLTIYYTCRGDQHLASIILGWWAMIYTGVALLTTPALVWLSRRVGKREIVLLSMALLWLGSLLPWFCYTPNHPWLSLAPQPILGLGAAVLSTIAQSMTADACDVEELATGIRDSGMFSAFYNWMNKLGYSIGLGLSGLLVSLSGFSTVAATSPSAHSLLVMKLMLCATPFIGYGVSFALIWRYSITAEMMAGVRTELAQRRLG